MQGNDGDVDEAPAASLGAVSGSQNLGLKVIYGGPRTPDCTIVAIHGLNGDRMSSWTSHRTGFFWLRDMLESSFRNARILTFGYHDALDCAADTLLGDLIDDRTKNLIAPTSPIIMLAHSSGGTLAKQMYLLSAPNRNSRQAVQELHAAIHGFIFLGTRHRGTFSHGLIKMTHAISYLFSWLPFNVLGKQRAKTALFLDSYRRINAEFQHDGGENLPLACFYEMDPVSILGKLVSKEDATLYFPWVENRGLYGNHSQIAQLDSQQSPNWDRLLSGIRSVYNQATGSTPSSAPGLQPPTESPLDDIYSVSDEGNNVAAALPALRVLALDGGGVRGLFAVIVLQSIMEEVRKLDCPESEDAPRPCEYFDLIGGTSTGGLLGVMLGRLRMDLVACKLAYKLLSASIFKTSSWSIPGIQWFNAIRGVAWYSGEALESAIKEIISDRISMLERQEILSRQEDVGEVPMKNTRPNGTKTFVCAIRNQNDACERLRTYDSRTLEPSALCPIWQACRATSAASLYFPSITIDNRTYWDGGMNSNNPILEVIEEAKSEFGRERPFKAIVSIGTGKGPIADPSSNLYGVMRYAIHQMTNTQKKHAEFLSRYPDLLEDYFRLDEEGDLYKIDLADWKHLDRVELLANEYISSPQGKRKILACARKLARNPTN